MASLCVTTSLLVLLLYPSVSQGQTFIKTTKSIDTETEFIGQVSVANFDGQNCSVAKFLGIPYAQPPVGAKRFAKPEPMVLQNETYMATSYKNICFQKADPSDSCQKNMVMSEDCLFLNIFLPVPTLDVSAQVKDNGSLTLPAGTGRYAVFVWIHGGGFTAGSGNCVDPSPMATLGEIIVVTINYRLGALGFLTTENGVIPGNLGLWDQHEAIKWVNKNIQAFGGDPNRVTIGGQSAGSYSSIFQDLYPGNDNLFQRVIAQSGTPAAPKSVSTVGYYTALKLAQGLNCQIMDEYSSEEIRSCLLNASAQMISEAVPVSVVPMSLPIQPALDGDMIPVDPYTVMALNSTSTPSGYASFGKRDLLIGSNGQDGEVVYRLRAGLLSAQFKNLTIAYLAFKTTMSQSDFKKLAAEYFLQNNEDSVPDIVVNAILDRYLDWGNASDLALMSNRALQMLTDAFFSIPVVYTALSHEANQDNNGGSAYVYRFTLPTTSVDFKTKWISWFEGTQHSAEIPYLFGTFKSTAADVAIARTMMTYWSNFVKTGNPNLANLNSSASTTSTWPEFTSAGQSYMEIPYGTKPSSFPAAKEKHFWYSFIPQLKDSFNSFTTATPTFCITTTTDTAGTTIDMAGLDTGGAVQPAKYVLALSLALVWVRNVL
ncbi:cholinesterase-like [Physella acuta]|uniref:cholinesterase-like n=1 Tax=Physella acuta TaxID=109671 RepID=UPI0027DD06F0|nr:cholinesterase-like [Physella acuta]